MNRRAFFGVVVGLATLVSVTADAQPDAGPPKPPRAEIMVMHATQTPGAGSIDPLIGNLPQLKKPPFSSYNTYKLVDRIELNLERGKKSTYPLINEKLLELTWVDEATDHRFKIAAAIAETKLEVTASPNEPFFVAGQSYAGGILVVGITIKR